MRTVTTFLSAVVIAAWIGPTGTASTAERLEPPASETPASIEANTPADPLTLIGHTQEQAEVVDDLIDRYADAGLALPPLTIEFIENGDKCHGRDGLYDGSARVITICKTSTFTITHEIAHAWEAHNLTDADREVYRQLWDAPTWGSHEVEWGLRATERAANTIAWALLLDNPEPNQLFRAHVCTYRALTGNPPPHSLTAPCTGAIRPD